MMPADRFKRSPQFRTKRQGGGIGRWSAMSPEVGKRQYESEENLIIWVETKTHDGKWYYYQLESRKTTWKRPEGRGIKIIRHEEVGQYKNVSVPGAGNQNQDGPNIKTGTGRTGMVLSPEQFRHPPPERGPRPGPRFPTPDARCPQMDGLTKNTSHNYNQMPPAPAHQERDPQQHRPPLVPPFMGFAHEQFDLMRCGPPPPFVTQPPPGFPPLPVLNSNNQVAQSQHWGPGQMGEGVFVPTAVPPPRFNVEPPVGGFGMDPKVFYEWINSPGGKNYYSSTDTSNLEMPRNAVEFDEMQRAANRTLKTAKEEALSDLRKLKKLEQRAKRMAAEMKEKTRPISSTAVNGTPWCVVWTFDEKVFFFNPSTNESVWSRPRSLVGRVDVDELIRKCPVENKTVVEKVTSTTSPQQSTQIQIADKPTDYSKMDLELKASAGENENDPPTKKQKTEESPENENSKQNLITKEEKKVAKSKIEIKLNTLRDMTPSEAEVRAAKERAAVPLEVRLKQFQEMLIEKQISAFSTWEKELHKIVFDPRYLLLTCKERKATFDKYVKERAEVERKEKMARMKEVKDIFIKFLDEVKSQTRNYSKLSYSEFVHDFGRDERFKMVEKSRDRESYFLEHVVEAKRRENEEKAKLKQKDKDLFRDYLKEKISDYSLKWRDVRRKFDHNDSRFPLLSYEDKQELFTSHRRKLKSEAKERKKKEKEANNKEEENCVGSKLNESQPEMGVQEEKGHDSMSDGEIVNDEDDIKSESEKADDIDYKSGKFEGEWVDVTP